MSESVGDNGKVSVEVKFNGEMTGLHVDDVLFNAEHKEELTKLIKVFFFFFSAFPFLLFNSFCICSCRTQAATFTRGSTR